MLRERPGKRTSRRSLITEERRRKLEFRNRKVKELEAIKTQAVAEAVAKLVRTEIKEEVRLQLAAVLAVGGEPSPGKDSILTMKPAAPTVNKEEIEC